MDKVFDPYHQWLGIKPKDQPAHHYRLLGIELYEDDADVIENAADRQTMLVRTFQAGNHSDASQQILNEISAARICLLNAEKKAAYDAQLQATQAAPIRAAAVTAQPVAARATPIATAEPQAAPDDPYRAPTQPAFNLSTGSSTSLGRRSQRSSGWQAPVVGVAVAAVLAIVVFVLLVADEPNEPVAQRPKNRPATTSPKGSSTMRVDAGEHATLRRASDHRAPINSESDRVAKPPAMTNPADATPATTKPAESDAPGEVTPITPSGEEPSPPLAGTEPTANDSSEPAAGEPTLGPRPSDDPSATDLPATEDAQPRIAVPDAATRGKTLALVHELYDAQYKAANVVEGRRLLADTLMTQAEQTVDDHAARFVLLLEVAAADLATPDRPLASAAIDELVSTYQVSRNAAEKVILQQATSVTDGPGRAAVCQAGLALAAAALARDGYAHAKTVLETVEPVAQRTRDRDMIKEIRTSLAEVATRRDAFVAYQQVLATLEQNPQDTAAHDKAAAYLIQVKGDWPAGLAHLRQAGRAPLDEIAARDLAGSQDASEQAELGNQWWDASQTAKGAEQEAYLRRARHWYSSAIEQLTGLTQTQAENRLLQISQQLGEPVEIPGLVAHWPLDAGQGSTVREKITGAELPFVGNLAWVKERKTHVLGFPGGDDYLDMPRRDFGDQFTITLWMQPVAKASINCILANRGMNRFGGRFGGPFGGRFGRRDRNPGDFGRFGRDDGFALYFNPTQAPSGALIFSTTGEDGTENATTAGNVLTAGRWTHVAVAADRTARAAAIFVNGRLATNNAPVARGFDTSSDWRVGAFRSDDQAEHSYKGLLADLRVYNRVLTPQEIGRLSSP